MTDQDKAVIKETVVTTLTTLGIDVSDPLEVQADMLFLNKTRKLVGTMFTKAMLILVGLAVLGVAGVVTAAMFH